MIAIPYPCNMSQAMVFSTWQDHKNRPGYTGEPGTDIASYGQANIPIWAVLPGKVTRAKSYGYNDGYGNYAEIDHGVIDHKRVKTLCAHLASVTVSVGQKVKSGEVIGIMGTTGNSEGVHTHFILWIGGVNVDAQAYFTCTPVVQPPVTPPVIPPVTPPVTPPVSEEPAVFNLPEIPLVDYPKAKVSEVVTNWLNIRSAPNGIDIGDLWPGDEVEVLGSVEDSFKNIWLAIRYVDKQSGLLVYGYAAAAYEGEVYFKLAEHSEPT